MRYSVNIHWFVPHRQRGVPHCDLTMSSTGQNLR